MTTSDYVALVLSGGIGLEVVRQGFAARTARIQSEQQKQLKQSESLDERVDKLWARNELLEAKVLKLTEDLLTVRGRNADLVEENARFKAMYEEVSIERDGLQKDVEAIKQEHAVLKDQYQLLVRQMSENDKRIRNLTDAQDAHESQDAHETHEA